MKYYKGSNQILHKDVEPKVHICIYVELKVYLDKMKCQKYIGE